MGAEYFAVMDDGSGAPYTTEHELVRNIAGDVESSRARLAEALERLGYRVLNENPLQARRSATSCGAAACSNNILDYQTTVNIGLKQVGHNTTRATFDYTVKYYYLTKGDKQTLTREAEAIIALANARLFPASCVSCGAEISSVSRFCRQCGAPAVSASPTEVELLRVTAITNTSYKNVLPGAIFLGVALLLPTILFFANPESVKFTKLVLVISILAGSLGISGLTMLINGLWQMRKALHPKTVKDALPNASRPILNAPDTSSLPIQSAVSSVTDATTDLLPQEAKRVN